MVLAIRKLILELESWGLSTRRGHLPRTGPHPHHPGRDVRRRNMLYINLFHTESRLFMKVEVDAHRCQGHTLCAMAAPELFELSDIDGHATAVDAEVPAEREETAREAARSCPEQAITIL